MITAQQGDYSWSDRLRVSIGVGVTVLSIATLNHLFGGLTPEENMVTAVFGVSALCIFWFPDSCLFSPLVLIEANLMASCVAFICVYVFPSNSMGILFAVAGTMGGMYLLRMYSSSGCIFKHLHCDVWDKKLWFCNTSHLGRFFNSGCSEFF